MSSPEDDDRVDDLDFLRYGGVSGNQYKGEIIPVLTSNEYLDTDELQLLKGLNFSASSPAIITIGRDIRPDLVPLIVQNQTDTLVLRAQSKAQFASVLRYIFRGDYTKTHPGNNLRDMQLEHDIFRSIRFHVDMAILAEEYQLPDLVTQAKGKIFKELERSCSDPYPPGDLIDTIPYIYHHLANNQGFIEDIAEYCVTNYYTHGLYKRDDFQHLLMENDEFNVTMRAVDMRSRIQNGGSTAPLEIPLTKAQARARQLDAEIKLDGSEFWEDSYESEHSSDTSVDDNLPSIERLAIHDEECGNDEEGELLEALIVSAPASLENSLELPDRPNNSTYASSTHLEEDEDWEMVSE